MGGLFSRLLESFFSRHLELVLVGLDGAGKSTLLNVLAQGSAGETTPTIGLNVKVLKKGNVVIKAWDLGGQQSYRPEWSRYARGVDVIIFVVDTADAARVPVARKELHRLLEDPALAHTPLLVAANKIDIVPHLSEEALIKSLNLDYIMDSPWVVIPISARHQTNIDGLLDWLMKQKATP